MASQVSGLVSGATGTGLGGLNGALQGGVSNLVNTGSAFLDRWFPPEKREALKEKLVKFATEKPHLAAFLLSQLALSGGPLALFLVMSLTVLVFALVVGILVGVIGALLFTVFCLGVALIILLPTLFFTTFAACFVFLWGIGTYYIIKWFNKKDIPGIHTDMKDGAGKQLGLDNLPNLNGQVSSPPAGERPEAGGPEEKKDANGHASGGHGERKENKAPHSNSSPSTKRAPTPSGKGTGADIGGDLKKKAGGITSGVGLT